MTLSQVRYALDTLGLRPSKGMGQNFLIDANILRIIVEQADIRPDETVLEVGPGLGVLTQELLLRARYVVAIEKDARLCVYLREKFPALELTEGDATDIVLPGTDKVVSNLPYNVGTVILERLVEAECKARRIVVTLQREVAQRLAAQPRHRDYGALTLFTQLHYHVTIAHIISPGCFFPAPNVESAVVVLDRRDPRVKLATGAPFHGLVRAGFGQRRKMLRKLLGEFAGAEAAMTSIGVTSSARAEELSLDQWIALANALRFAS